MERVSGFPAFRGGRVFATSSPFCLWSSLLGLRDHATERRSVMEGNFLDQRRNLILSSFVLLFFLWSKITLEKINVFGTTFTLDNSASVTGITTVVWLYFLWRYYQYFRKEKRDQSDYKKMYRSYLTRSLFKRARSLMRIAHPSIITSELYLPLELSESDGDHSVFAKFRVFYGDKLHTPSSLKTDDQFILVPIRRKLFRWFKFKARCWCAFHTNWLSEYHIPWIVAAIPASLLLIRLAVVIYNRL